MSPTLRVSYRAREFLRRLVEKSREDDVFFMAGAVAFNLVIATLPLLLLGVGLTGYVLSAQVADPADAIVALVAENVPQVGATSDFLDLVRSTATQVLAQRTGFTLLGALIFVLLVTRLVSTVRVVVREIFDIGQDRGVFSGKLFDAVVVVAGVLLMTLNLGATVTLEAAVDFGVGFFGFGDSVVSLAERAVGYTVSLVSIWALFLGVYRYLPARRIPWRTAIVAATFAAVSHETLKYAFSWYATELADYTSTWGNLATVGVLFFWIYYEAVVFIVGGEVAQVYTMRKARNVQVGTKLQGEG